jgi:hypothetical protein
VDKLFMNPMNIPGLYKLPALLMSKYQKPPFKNFLITFILRLH